MAVDPDHVPGGCRVDAAMLRRGQVSPHCQDLVKPAAEPRNSLEQGLALVITPARNLTGCCKAEGGRLAL
jgi:hypothetical protein